VCALTEGTAAVDDVDTETNSTISQADSETAVEPTMTDTQLTMRLYRRLTGARPMSVDGKLPTLDDVRAVIATDFSKCNDLWKVTEPKKVVSRSVTRRCQLLRIYDRPPTGRSVVVGTDKVYYSYALSGISMQRSGVRLSVPSINSSQQHAAGELYLSKGNSSQLH